MRTEAQRAARKRQRCRARARRACAEKVGYGTEYLALLTLQKLLRRGRPERRAYQCEVCGRWHLTSGEKFMQKRAPAVPAGGGQ